jgi:cytochrome c-type biogenesis protein CcmH/NrfG
MEHLGDVYLKTGRNQEALDYYRKAVKIDPDNKALNDKIERLQK